MYFFVQVSSPHYLMYNTFAKVYRLGDRSNACALTMGYCSVALSHCYIIFFYKSSCTYCVRHPCVGLHVCRENIQNIYVHKYTSDEIIQLSVGCQCFTAVRNVSNERTKISVCICAWLLVFKAIACWFRSCTVTICTLHFCCCCYLYHMERKHKR